MTANISRRSLSRRSFLLGGAGVLGSLALTACGGSGSESGSTAATSGAAASGSAGGTITVGASPSPTPRSSTP